MRDKAIYLLDALTPFYDTVHDLSAEALQAFFADPENDSLLMVSNAADDVHEGICECLESLKLLLNYERMVNNGTIQN